MYTGLDERATQRTHQGNPFILRIWVQTIPPHAACSLHVAGMANLSIIHLSGERNLVAGQFPAQSALLDG